MARKLDAQFEGMYLMPSVLMTSTMKSDPGNPLTRASSRGEADSAAAVFAEGGNAEGALGGASAASALCGVMAVAALAARAPARNWRRSTFTAGLLFMALSSCGCRRPRRARANRVAWQPGS